MTTLSEHDERIRELNADDAWLYDAPSVATYSVPKMPPITRFDTPTDTSRRLLRQPAASGPPFAHCWRGYPDRTRTRRRINHVPLHLPRG